MIQRVEFAPNPSDPDWEKKYWAGALDSYHGFVAIGLPGFALKIGLGSVWGLNYPALIAREFGSSSQAEVLRGQWEMSSQKAAGFLQSVDPYLISKKLQADLAIEFQIAKALTHRRPVQERSEYSLMVGEDFAARMHLLNTSNLFNQSRFNVPDQLDPAYLIARLEFGLQPVQDDRKEGGVKGLVLEGRSQEVAKRIQAYFGGSIVDMTDKGFRNIWGIEEGKELLKIQSYFKLRYIVYLDPPFIRNPEALKKFEKYHQGAMNLAVTDQSDNVDFLNGRLEGFREFLAMDGLADYTDKSRQQAQRISAA